MNPWPRKSLGEVAESVDYGVTASASTISNGPKFLRITDIQNGSVNWDTVPWCECDAKTAIGSRLETGDIVFARTGATTGKSFLISTCPKDAVFASYLIRVRMKDDVEPRYVSNFFQSEDYWAQITRGSRGAAQPGVNATTLKALEIPIPPFAEQRRIAAILDQADALRAKRREALAQLDNLTQSIFIEMFGDPVVNPKKWATCTLGEIAREKPNNGIFRKNTEYVEGDQKGIPVVWLDELFKGTSIDTSESRRLDPTTREIENYGLKTGDLLFCRSSLKLDGIAFNNVYMGADNAALFECHLIRIPPNLTKVNPIFITHLLRLPQLRAMIKSRAKTSTMTTIDQQGLCAVSIFLPPLPEQDIFASRIQAVEVLKSTQRAALKEFDSLFASLQNRAFRGEL